MKPACYIRMRFGKPDWAEDCVSEDAHSLASGYPAKEGYSTVPLYSIPKGWTLVPNEPTDGMLRAFLGCPDDELRLAWAAMLRVTQATVPVVETESLVTSAPPTDATLQKGD